MSSQLIVYDIVLLVLTPVRLRIPAILSNPLNVVCRLVNLYAELGKISNNFVQILSLQWATLLLTSQCKFYQLNISIVPSKSKHVFFYKISHKNIFHFINEGIFQIWGLNKEFDVHIHNL